MSAGTKIYLKKYLLCFHLSQRINWVAQQTQLTVLFGSEVNVEIEEVLHQKIISKEKTEVRVLYLCFIVWC